MHKAKDYLLQLNSLRKTIGFNSFLQAIKSEIKLEMMNSPIDGDALVISPHPDDDVFGCGGTIKLHNLAGNRVKTLVLSNGKNRVRMIEIEKSADVLGEETSALDIDDGKIIGTNYGIIEAIIADIKEINPSLIYCPSPFDPNPDHAEVAKAVASALMKVDFNGEIYCYEVWQPIATNRLIKIDKSIDYKIKAIEAHQSQLKDRPYKKAILGLNQYRANMFGHGEYAEAFFACNKELYLKLVNLAESK